MARTLDPFQSLLVVFAGWTNLRQQQTIEYLREENRVLREQMGHRRLRFNDDQCRGLAAKAKGLGCRLLAEVATPPNPRGPSTRTDHLLRTGVKGILKIDQRGGANSDHSKYLHKVRAWFGEGSGANACAVRRTVWELSV